jgi:hypothetical protein
MNAMPAGAHPVREPFVVWHRVRSYRAVGDLNI